MLFYPFILLLPLTTTSLIILNCGHCPPQSACAIDSNGNERCLCNKGFTGDNCEIVLCDETSCFGPDSICEFTSQGPLCHCQDGREGSNCELLESCNLAWQANPICEDSHNNGRCDEICNNPECIYDGHDCYLTSGSSKEQHDIVRTSLLMVKVDLSPSIFFSERSKWLMKLSRFLNKSVTIAQQGGYDRIFVMDENGTRIIVSDDVSPPLNFTSVEVDLAIDISECNNNLDECDHAFEQLYHSINDSIGSKELSSLHISFAAVTYQPDSASTLSNSHTFKIIAIVSIIGAIFIIGVLQRVVRKRTQQVEADEYQLQTLEESHLPPIIKRVRPQRNSHYQNHLHIIAASPNAIQITDRNRTLVNECDSMGRTPLHVLAALGRDAKSSDLITEDARTLICNGADVNVQDNEGNTILHLALWNSRISIVEMLIDHPNIDVKVTNNRKQTAMHICASLSDTYSLDLLLKHPDSMDTLEMIDIAHNSPLVINILHSSANTTFAEKLLIAGASTDYNSNEGPVNEVNCERSALHYAAEYGLIEHIKLLIQHNAKVNAIDMLRMTPLHYAVRSNRLDVVTLLLSLGAEKGVHSHYNETPVDLAKRMGLDEIVHHFNSAPRIKKASTKHKRATINTKETEKRKSNDTGYQTESPRDDFNDEVDPNNGSGPSHFVNPNLFDTPSPSLNYSNFVQGLSSYYPNQHYYHPTHHQLNASSDYVTQIHSTFEQPNNRNRSVPDNQPFSDSSQFYNASAQNHPFPQSDTRQ